MFENYFERISFRPPSAHRRATTRFFAILSSAWLCFPILNSINHTAYRTENSIDSKERLEKEQANTSVASNAKNSKNSEPEFAGRTLDLTLFATIRAIDVLTSTAWDYWKCHRKTSERWTRLEKVVPKVADTGVFALSSAIVMWAWFYLPERLPYSYGRWISEAAQVDSRLIDALRTARRGEWTYGKTSSNQPDFLQSMCRDYGWPEEWGDSSTTVPFPCDMVHMGCGPSCEKHAIWRFGQAFNFACMRYLPLQIFLRWRSPSFSGLLNAFRNAFRSSAFLGFFVSIFYYSVCLARTRLGPKVFDRKTVTPMMWDSGLCVAAGCIMCGWSIFVESDKKRQEIALFVAPRAAATLLPRLYERKVRSSVLVG